MTKEEAIRELKQFSGTTRLRLSANFWEALNMAIKALEKEPKTGHWNVIDQDREGDEGFVHVWETLCCSRCGMERTTEDGYIPQYCESCGAKMDE